MRSLTETVKKYRYMNKNTKSVQKICGHFEYHKNWLKGLDETWQPIKEDLTVCIWTDTLLWSYSVSNKMSMNDIVCCMTTTFTSRFYTSFVGVSGKILHHSVLSVSTPTCICLGLALCKFKLFLKLKLPLKCWG